MTDNEWTDYEERACWRDVRDEAGVVDRLRWLARKLGGRSPTLACDLFHAARIIESYQGKRRTQSGGEARPYKARGKGREAATARGNRREGA